MKAEQIIAHTDTLELTAALWWFIDNMPADSLASTEVRLHLQERVRVRRNIDPQYCPYCGGRDVMQVNGWQAYCSDDRDNTADIDEWQCRACDGRSFWS